MSDIGYDDWLEHQQRENEQLALKEADRYLVSLGYEENIVRGEN